MGQAAQTVDMEVTGEAVASQPTMASSSNNRWYVLAILTLIYACHHLDRSVVSILIEPIRHEFGLSDAQLGLLTGLAYSAAFAVAGIPIGLMIDRVNRRNLLGGLVFLWSGLTAVCGFTQSYTTLLLARMGVGAAEAGGSPTSMSLIGDLFPLKERSTAIGLFFVNNGIAAIATFFVGAYVATQYGWRSAFFVAGLPGIVLALVLLGTVKEPLRGGHDKRVEEGAKAPSLPTVLRHILANRSLVHLFVAMPLLVTSVASLGAWLAPFCMRHLGMELKGASLIVAVAIGVFGSLGSLAGGWLSDRLIRKDLRYRPLFAAAACLVCIPVSLGAMLTTSSGVALALIFLAATLMFAAIPPGFANMISMVTPRMRGVTSAFMQIATNLIGYGAGPFFVGLLSDQLGGAQFLRYALAMVMSCALLLGTIHFALSARSSSGPEEGG